MIAGMLKAPIQPCQMTRALALINLAVMVASANNWNLLKQARRGVLTL